MRALIRTRTSDPPEGVGEWVVGDLGDATALARLTAGADLVVHMAGLIKARDRAAFFAVNVEGTARLARAVGGARLLLVSSLAAREPALSDYAASKKAGEDAARAAAGERLTIVRPPAIYGPGDRETLALFQAAAASPVLPMIGPPHARLALAHVDDVVSALVALAARAPGPGPFAIGGARPEGYDWREIMTAAGRAVGRRPVLAPLPAGAVRGVAAFAAGLARVTGAPTIFGPGKARELLHPDWSVAPNEQAPGAPRAVFSLDDGFADTVRWYREHGWLASGGIRMAVAG